MSRVLVLGCGPAGLVAAQAAHDAGAQVVVLSKRRKSEMFGAQYLHEPVPGYEDVPSHTVDYVLNGTAEEYRAKVYGPDSNERVSPDSLGSQHPGWDIRTTYDRLWDRWFPSVIEASLSGQALSEYLWVARETYDLVVNSIPAPTLCLNFNQPPEDPALPPPPSPQGGERSKDACNFAMQQVWAVGDAPERGVFSPVRHIPGNTVVCDSTADIGWYRSANVFGHVTTEWPWRDGRKPPVEEVAAVTKPLHTTCACWPNMLRVGRYGMWRKGVLVHEAYARTQAAVSAL